MKKTKKQSMQVTRMYLVTWLQRTTIHLKEMHDFFRGHFNGLHLDPEILKKNRSNLSIDSVELTEKNDFEVLVMKSGPYTFTAIEDGVFMISAEGGQDITKTRKGLEDYYRNHMGAALAYLFSRGAQLPKRLSEVTEFYPVVMVVKDGTEDDVKNLYEQLNEEYNHTVSSLTTQIFFGDVFTVLRLFKRDSRRDEVIDDLVGNIIFLQEFYHQLRDYLNTHRLMWDKITEIRESRNMRYKDFPVIRRKIMDFLKTLLFINARLNQMKDIAQARYNLLRGEVKAELEECQLLRFENAIADLQYIRDLWEMTIEYVKETLSLLESLFQENTQRELNAVKYVTMMAAITGFFGMNIAFPWEERWSNISSSSFVVISVIIFTFIIVHYILKRSIYYRKFIVRDK